ncbi:MAG: STAS domain-containing protein [Desulfomonilia bacterium]|jgi:anti-anti-sigma factor
MEINTDSQGVIVFKGNLVVSNIEVVHSALESVLEESSRNIVIDISQVEEIDIAGLQLLFSLKKTLEGDGSMHIRSLNQSIRDILDLSGFGVALKEALP